MIFHIEFTDKALEDIDRLRKAGNVTALRKLASFYVELQNHPRTGIGQIEKLMHFKEETWSRRITKEHRLIYRVSDDKVVVLILSAYGHYE